MKFRCKTCGREYERASQLSRHHAKNDGACSGRMVIEQEPAAAVPPPARFRDDES